MGQEQLQLVPLTKLYIAQPIYYTMHHLRFHAPYRSNKLPHNCPRFCTIFYTLVV